MPLDPQMGEAGEEAEAVDERLWNEEDEKEEGKVGSPGVSQRRGGVGLSPAWHVLPGKHKRRRIYGPFTASRLCPSQAEQAGDDKSVQV